MMFQIVSGRCRKFLCSLGCFSSLGLFLWVLDCFTLLSAVFGCFKFFSELFQIIAVVQVVLGCFRLFETFQSRVCLCHIPIWFSLFEVV